MNKPRIRIFVNKGFSIKQKPRWWWDIDVYAFRLPRRYY